MKYISKEDQERFHELHRKIAAQSETLTPYLCSSPGNEFSILIKDPTGENIIHLRSLREAYAFAHGLEYSNI